MTDLKHVSPVRRMMAALSAYVDAPDPLVKANNVLALMVASNQPFYPFYVRFVAGDENYVSFLTLLSTPFFLTIPLLARWGSPIALAGIPILGLANGMLAMKALGTHAGIELFLIPCLLVALLLSHNHYWKIVLGSAIAAALVFSAQFLLQTTSLHTFNAQEYISLYRLNAFSVAGLTLFITYSFGRARFQRTKIKT